MFRHDFADMSSSLPCSSAKMRPSICKSRKLQHINESLVDGNAATRSFEPRTTRRKHDSVPKRAADAKPLIYKDKRCASHAESNADERVHSTVQWFNVTTCATDKSWSALIFNPELAFVFKSDTVLITEISPPALRWSQLHHVLVSHPQGD